MTASFTSDQVSARAAAEHLDTRLAAARVLVQVADKRRSLNTVLPPVAARVASRDHGFLRECCYGCLRWHIQLTFLLEQLLDKPLKIRERELHALLLVGLYQLIHLRIPQYAIVSETVKAARRLGKPWAAGLVNAVLRNFQRRRTTLLAELERDATLSSAHPEWLLERFKSDWPQDWRSIVTANNTRPGQNLRVNLSRLSRTEYLRRLSAAGIEAAPAAHAPAGITLADHHDVTNLPGFAEGLVSVQDPAAQLAAILLDLKPGLRVLDACAAPGGKTCHILETEPALNHLTALDMDSARLRRLHENLGRLQLDAIVKTGDASMPDCWWDDAPYDRILLDAPCTATGIIRRHPDIKLLRKPDDSAHLAVRQQTLLKQLWPLLAPGGLLLYATCSLDKQENENNVGRFLARQSDAVERRIEAPWGRLRPQGRQILPGNDGMDGFYYACLSKRRDE